MSGHLWIPAVVLAGLTGCSLSAPAVIPLAEGASPRSILILPISGRSESDEVSRSLLATIGPALQHRGYYPIPVEIGFAMLLERGVEMDDALAADQWAELARDIGADAFLTLRVEQFDASYAPSSLVHLRYDIGYRLWSAETGALLWEMRNRDEWTWDPGTPTIDPQSSRAGYLNPIPTEPQPSPYHDNVDAARMIHARSLQALPRRS